MLLLAILICNLKRFDKRIKKYKINFSFFTDLDEIFLVQIICDEFVDENHDPSEVSDVADGLGQEYEDPLVVVVHLLQVKVPGLVVVAARSVALMAFPQLRLLGLNGPCLHVPTVAKTVKHFPLVLLPKMFAKL